MNTKHEQEADEILAAAGLDPETGTEQAPDMPDASEAEKIARAMELLLAENAELKDRVLRAAAEMENLRNRTARDVRDAKTYAVTGFARDLLPIADNLNRALAAFPETSPAAADPTVMALLEGVDLTERSLLNTLERHGVRKLEPEGQRFDPHFHQAMFEVPNPDVPNNTVVQVVQSGYVIADRVLRPAMVGVAKGGPKDAPKPEPVEDDETA
ncbi:MAG: nucleotide exchange factor GrpE [Rhizobiaceae bacterium]